jgi:hypothetical protein
MSMRTVTTVAPRPPDTRLHGRALMGARIAWLAMAGLTISLAVAGFSIALQRPQLVGPPAVDQALARAGINPVVSISLVLIPLMAAFAISALVIFWRRSDDWMAMFFALMLLTLGAACTRSLYVLDQVYPVLAVPVRLVWGFGLYSWMPVLYLFPNGRFVPNWTWPMAFACAALPVLFPDFGDVFHRVPDLPPDLPTWRWGALLASIVLPGGVGVLAQVHRYRHVSTPAERQQSKWVVFSLGGAFVLFCVAFALPTLIWKPGEWFGWMMVASTVPMSFIPLSTAMAVLRYRLWDVDPLINRALVYGLLTAGLGLVYWGGIVLLQQVLRPFIQGSELGVIGSTLAVFALFQPARGRIQGFVDRRFYRRKYDAQRTLTSFGASLRHEVELDHLGERLVDVVRDAVQPNQVFLWLRPTADKSPETVARHAFRNDPGTIGG